MSAGNADVGRRHVVRQVWTAEDDAELAELWATCSLNRCAALMGRGTGSIYNRMIKLGIKRTDEQKAAASSGRFGTRAPWNKGMKVWKTGGKSKETQFKTGQISSTWRPVGAERTDMDGTLYRKIADTNVKRDDWRAVHVMAWEASNGPLPAGHIVVFKDRDRDNYAPGNLIAVTRAENMQRNSIGRYPPEYRQAAITLGWFKKKLRDIEENEEPI